MHICHVQGIFSPEHGGPAHSLANYCRGQVAQGHEVSAWVLEGFPHTSPAIRLAPPVRMHVCAVDAPAALGRSRRLRAELRSAAAPDVFHLHGAWLRAMHYGAVEARRRRVPCVVELMGMYEPYGLAQKWLRKAVARRWFQDALLRRADCLHVNSVTEGEHLRRLGFTAPLAVIPVGVDTSSIASAAQRVAGATPWPELNGRPFGLYLARLHEKKGIELLLRAWARLEGGAGDHVLLVGGTGESAYVQRCQALAGQLGLTGRVLWTGRMSEDQKAWAMSHAAAYVLPSYSENFGNAVAEALAHGTPVITTTRTPWGPVGRMGCGWITEPAVEPLAEALRAALATPAEQRRRMGRAGAEWVEREFALPAVLRHLDETYRWLRGGVRPACVLP